MIFWHCRKLDGIFELKLFIYFIYQFNDMLNFFTDLVHRNELVCIILMECPDSHKTMQGARFFMSVNKSHLSISDRKLTI